MAVGTIRMADFTFAHRKEGFDEHIEHSIRGYSNLLEDIVGLSRYFVEDDTNVIDVGCSTGKLTKAIIDYNMTFNNGDKLAPGKYIGIEIADGFVENLKKRKKDLTSHDVEFIIDDVRNYKFNNCSLVTSVFTLQFMSKRDRLSIIKKIYKGLNDGGAFIFAEKTICQNALVQDMITFNYYDYKRKSFDTDDIMDKERTLRHMMKPNTWQEIIDMIQSAGFSDAQPFWRNHAFVGAIAIK
jgi:tRNA (cmo5U34)-methyltransferase|tara:strand:- start:5 stop:724 length:720 start_codon:yes stop_codon:yes gene_type:complete